MPGLGVFPIGVNSVFLVGKRHILGGLIDVRTWIFARDSGNFFPSGFTQKLSIKVCLEFFNQGTIDPDQFFNHVHDCDAKISIRV